MKENQTDPSAFPEGPSRVPGGIVASDAEHFAKPAFDIDEYNLNHPVSLNHIWPLRKPIEEVGPGVFYNLETVGDETFYVIYIKDTEGGFFAGHLCLDSERWEQCTAVYSPIDPNEHNVLLTRPS